MNDILNLVIIFVDDDIADTKLILTFIVPFLDILLPFGQKSIYHLNEYNSNIGLANAETDDIF